MLEPILLLLTSLVAGSIPLVWRLLRENPRLGSYLQRVEEDPQFIKWARALGVAIPTRKEHYHVRMEKLVTKFGEVSAEADAIILELETNLRSKKSVVDALEMQRDEIARRLEELKNTPEFGTLEIQRKLESMDAALKKDSRGGAFRDYLLYALGVGTPYAISWIVRLTGVTFSPR